MTTSARTTPRPNGHSRLRRLAILGGPLTRPISGRRFFPLYGVIHHVGRTSGRPYATPVVVREAGGAYFVPLPFGERTDWLRNALAAGGARLTWKGRDRWLANPAVVHRSEAQRGFNAAMLGIMGLTGIDRVVRFEPAAEGPAEAPDAR